MKERKAGIIVKQGWGEQKKAFHVLTQNEVERAHSQVQGNGRDRNWTWAGRSLSKASF